MKPTGKKNYGSIPHLSNSKLGSGDYFITEGQERILTVKKRDRHDTIIVTEKYDGSNVGIAKVNGSIVALTRAGYLATSSPYKQHHLFADWVAKMESLFDEILGEGERICGEWMAQAHGLKYEIEGDPIVFFDYFGNDGKRILYDDLRMLTDNYNLKMPRLIHWGDAVVTDELMTVLNEKTPTVKAVDLPEGMVYRVERHGKVDFLAKWVRSDFPTGQYIIDVKDEDLTWNTIK